MMNFAGEVSENVILWSSLTAWFIAQVLKLITSFYSNGELNISRLVGAGGMPSSHTALVVSLASAVGLHDGFNSPLFALAFVLATIVMYDAAGVRRAAGKQAKVINKLLTEIKYEHTLKDTRLKELLGHTPLEVFAGSILGFGVAYTFSVIYK